LLAHGRWFSPGTPASSTTKTGHHEIAEILLKVALNTKNKKSIKSFIFTSTIYAWDFVSCSNQGVRDTASCHKVVKYLQSAVFPWNSDFLNKQNWTPQYYCNIIVSGVTHQLSESKNSSETKTQNAVLVQCRYHEHNHIKKWHLLGHDTTRKNYCLALNNNYNKFKYHWFLP
jgi:hypothetical protein